MSDDQASDPLEAICRYCRSINLALTVIDRTNTAATVITDRMRGTIETLLIDVGELKHFTAKRTEN